MIAPSFAQLTWQCKRIAARLGRTGVLGGLLIAGCVLFYLAVSLPLKKAAEKTRLDTQALQRRMQEQKNSSAKIPTPAEQLTAFYQKLPTASGAPDSIQKIYDAARAHNLHLEQGEYRLSHDNGGQLARYELIFPVKGGYLQVRKFIDQVLAENSSIALDSIGFQRQKVGDATIQSQVKFILFLKDGA